MDLWIRSQDKKSLFRVSTLFVEEDLFTNKGEYRIVAHEGWLGKYKTKERALEVLDEIQRLLMPNAKLISNKDFEGNDVKVYGVEYIGSYVYEMPKE